MDSFLRTLFGVGWVCPTGYEPDPVLGYGTCYKICPAGYAGVSFLCWPICLTGKDDNIVYPTGWTDLGPICLKNSYNRGQGTQATNCPADYPDYRAALCYKACQHQNGFKTSPYYPSDPTVCVAACPLNTTSATIDTCNKNPGSEYGRGFGSQGIGCPPGYTNFGTFCYKPPFSFASYRCPGEDNEGNPVNGGRCSYGPRNGNDGTNGKPCSYWNRNKDPSNPCYGIPNTDPDSPQDPNYNTVLSPRNQNTCEENWGTFCYPKCDISYHNVGCCLCSPNCTNMTDYGAFCGNRFSYYRGSGVGPSGCADPEQVIQNSICRAPCEDGFEGYNNYCTKKGCPKGTNELKIFGLSTGACIKVPLTRDYIQGTPPVAGFLNYKLNLGAYGDLFRQVFFNYAFAIGILLIIFAITLFMGLKSKHRTLQVSKPPLYKAGTSRA